MATGQRAEVFGPAPDREPPRVPFPVADEIARHCADAREPNTVHLEIHLPGRIEPDRLREAFGRALARHPRALMRERRRGPFARRYEWELTDRPRADVVLFPPCAPGALARARERALAVAPSLLAAPPLRLEVVEEPGSGGCVLVLAVHHTALDGPACLRIVATAAEIYGGSAAQPVAPPARPPAGPAPRPAGSRAAVARVAPGSPQGAPGNALLVTELPVPRRAPGASHTVNDQLMVATALTVADWNRRRGAPERPLRVTMPVDDRTRGPAMPIGNGTRLVEVGFAPAELAAGTDTGALLRTTAERTRALKAVVRPPLGHGAALLASPVLPVAARAALTRGVRRLAAPWISTTLLSNLGRVPYPFDFGEAGRARAVWMSAPAAMPRGLTFTTASTGGRLHLALRWSRTLLGDEDGALLCEMFTERLAATEAEAL
ncbi:condensation protein [Streptomyces sp. SID5770]|uniref:condensation protein n=1 Tax=Streptomyces sp. SID5770 TaxID=2690308 RepID=UPI0013692808|nr:condensation protein [Streptomyces sp. SID5770]MZE55599.1 condensation protein [Streptomyces sp. SID5770]